jgi:hypothetical protein
LVSIASIAKSARLTSGGHCELQFTSPPAAAHHGFWRFCCKDGSGFVGDYSGVTANFHLTFNLDHSMKVGPCYLRGKITTVTVSTDMSKKGKKIKILKKKLMKLKAEIKKLRSAFGTRKKEKRPTKKNGKKKKTAPAAAKAKKPQIIAKDSTQPTVRVVAGR